MPRIQSLSAIDENALAKLTERAPKYGTIIEALEGHGAGVSDIARTIGDILNYGTSDSSKLRAAELAANLHGLGKTNETTTINFIVKSEEGVNLQNIFNPQR